MDKVTLNYITEKTHELMSAPSCCPEAKTAAQTWLGAIGTANEAEETKKYFAELKEDILPIDDLIAFTGSDAGQKVFGDKAAAFNAHGKEVKAAGGKYCDCPACSAVAAILAKEKDL